MHFHIDRPVLLHLASIELIGGLIPLDPGILLKDNTSRKQAISPGWEGPLVPVPQPGLKYRD